MKLKQVTRYSIRAVLFSVLAGTSASGASPDACGLPLTFSDPHPVIHDHASLVWVRSLQVDADGASRAYHRDDPYASKGLAIEYLGNGMTITQQGEPIPFLLDQKPNPRWLEAYRKIVRSNWAAPQGYSVQIYGFAVSEAGSVCVSDSGRLTSSTSLTLNPHAPVCHQNRYVDALTYTGIVVPNRAPEEPIASNVDPEVAPPFAVRGVNRGDLAVVYNPETGLWQGAFIYDTGPRQLLGEGSIRLITELRGKAQLPTSGLETNSIALAETYTVLFPGSVAALGPKSSWTPAKIKRVAAEHFAKWGGGTLEGALHRLHSCANAYKARTQ